MKALATTAALMMAVAIPVAAAAQDYPAAPGVEVNCSFAEPTVTCTGTGFEGDSSVDVVAVEGTQPRTAAARTGAADGDEIASSTETASANGSVTFAFQVDCDVTDVSVTMSGTNQDGNADSDSDLVVTTTTCPDDKGGGGGGNALPQTGGGLALLAGVSLLGAATLRRRR